MPMILSGFVRVSNKHPARKKTRSSWQHLFRNKTSYTVVWDLLALRGERKKGESQELARVHSSIHLGFIITYFVFSTFLSKHH